MRSCKHKTANSVEARNGIRIPPAESSAAAGWTRTPSHRRYGCVSNEGPNDQKHFCVGWDLLRLVRCLLSYLQSSQVVRSAAVGLPRALTRQARAANGAHPSHPSCSGQDGPQLPPKPSRAGTGHGPAHPSPSPDSLWRDRRRGALPVAVPSASTASGAVPRLAGPGRPGWSAGA